MTTERSDEQTTLTARSPEDVLALVPVMLGFAPSESLVMLTFGGSCAFHARVDLPEEAGDIDTVADQLVAPARQHRVPRALLVAYSERDRLATRTLRATARRLEREGIDMIGGLRTDGRRWHPVPRQLGIPDTGVPYDLSGHPFLAQAVYHGRTLLSSREELASSLLPDPDLVARVVAALAERTGEPAPALEEGCWARELVVRHVDARSSPDDHDVARLLRAMLDVRVRDAAWSPLRRDRAVEHVAFWTDVVRRTPDTLLAAPAALLAFAAWQAGHGALAWCALDRCLDAAPDYSLATLVGELLERAVPPDSWVGDFDWTLGMGTSTGMPPQEAG